MPKSTASLCLLLVALSAQGADLARIEFLLDAGRIHEADSLFQESSNEKASRHRHEILSARLAATQGNWKKTDARLRAWKNSSERNQGSGEIFFWLGWSALHQGKKSSADSLFVLASAYTIERANERSTERDTERGAQEALEYRFAALLETSPALLDYLRGLSESPLPDSMRLASLQRLPKSSRLYPYGQWQLALLVEVLGDTARSREILTQLAAKPGTLPGRKAAARLNYLREPTNLDSAKTGYEGLLMKQQQGVSAEFARKRLQILR